MSAIWKRRLGAAGMLVVAAVALEITRREAWLDGDQLGVIAAVASVVAAVAAWKATSRASDTAEAMAAIERDRWHVELTPQLEVHVRRPSVGERATLSIKLMGPPGLERLDAVTIQIRDDDVDRTPRTAGPPTAADVAAHIWGPLNFIPGIDNVPAPGRTTPPFPLEVGRMRPFAMTNTMRPFWWDDDDATRRWRLEVRDQPVRLWIECRLEGRKPWFIYREAKIESPFAPS
ncbi:hypothetical protein ACFU5Y_04395 [Streptomyces gardneri]|uniref:hypothetical protein n=1 Tax=Streptomyces gardneri TaxID=66892 RepID=UPI00367BD8FC